MKSLEGLKNHPAADAFPMFDKKRHEELKEDIEKNGVREPITICDGMVLDGRNRYKACVELGIDPPTRQFDGNPWSFAWSLNGARRDLADMQRAAIKLICDKGSTEYEANLEQQRLKIQQEANRKRSEATKGLPYAPKGSSRKEKVVVQHEQQPSKNDRAKGRAARAKAANVSSSTQARVEALANNRPDLFEKVASGQIKGTAAYKQMRKDKEAEQVNTIENAPAAKTKKKVAKGEWWQLGRHKLFCGDTSSGEFRDSLETASLAFADPPYGAGKEGYDDSKFYWEHDYLNDIADVVVVTPGIISIFEFAQKTKMPYKWSLACWINNGMSRGAMGFGNWIYGAVFSHNSVYRNSQDFKQVSITTSENADTKHTTRKPAKFVAWIVETFSKKNDVIIDPFSGSGQTLITCEVLGRTCITGEIDESFCSEIVARWEAVTKQEAIKL